MVVAALAEKIAEGLEVSCAKGNSFWAWLKIAKYDFVFFSYVQLRINVWRTDCNVPSITLGENRDEYKSDEFQTLLQNTFIN